MNYKKMKRIYNNFFEKIETGLTYKLVKTRKKLESRKYIQKNDILDKDYKKQIKEYWKKYGVRVNYRWFTIFSKATGIKDVRYIPEELYYTTIDGYFNSRKMGWGVNDKNYYSIWFADILQPVTINRMINGIYYDANYNLITKEQWVDLLKKYDKFIIKPSIDNGGGDGIVFYDKNKENLENLIERLTEKNYIIQEIVKQHGSLSKIYEGSLNTIRVMSLIKNGKVNIISSVLRMGANGMNVDNLSKGGISCGILNNGELREIAHNHKGEQITQHPQGFVFKNNKIENFEKVIELVKKAHEKMGHFRLISWDIAIREDGEPILIEANMRNGGIKLHQFNNGPLFGDMTDEILDEIFKKGKNI